MRDLTYHFDNLDQRASGQITVTNYAAGKLTAASGEITVVDYSAIISEASAEQTIIIDSYADLNEAAAVGSITVTDYASMVAAAASATITITDYTAIAGKSFVVGGNTYTEGIHFVAETDEATTATNLAAVIAIDSDVGAVAVGAVITITATASGTAGNAIGVSTNAASGVTLSAATLEGGLDNAVITVDGVSYTQGTDFTASVSNDSTATSLASAINGGAQGAAAVGAVITVTAATAGVAGNAIGMSIDAGEGATLSGSTLTGGLDYAVITIAGHALTAGTSFTAETDDATTATNLAAAINALSEVNASANSDVVTVVAATSGTEGNSITVAGSGEGFTLGGATLEAGADGDEVEVDSHALVAGVDFVVETSNEVTAENIKVVVHALANVNATRTGATVNVVAATEGDAGNDITLSTTSENITVSGETLAGGKDAASIAVGGTTLVESTDFTAETDNATTATNLAAAIEAISGFTATASDNVVTFYWETPGVAGNAKTLTTNYSVAYAISGATLTGGVAATYSDVLDFDPDEGESLEALLVVDSLSAGTLDATPQISFDKQTWNDKTAFTQKTAAGSEAKGYTDSIGLHARVKIVLGGSNPIASGKVVLISK